MRGLGGPRPLKAQGAAHLAVQQGRIKVIIIILYIIYTIAYSLKA
jgi:hypothetical protein